jgi:hypothetical protein
MGMTCCRAGGRGGGPVIPIPNTPSTEGGWRIKCNDPAVRGRVEASWGTADLSLSTKKEERP